MVLREARLEDVPVLAGAWYAMLEESGLLAPAVRSNWRDAVEAEFSRGIERGRHRWILVEADGCVAASGGVFFRRDPLALALTGPAATIAGMYTRPPYRRRGYARAILERLIATARSEECRSIRLRASPSARALYEEYGFGNADEMVLELAAGPIRR